MSQISGLLLRRAVPLLATGLLLLLQPGHGFAAENATTPLSTTDQQQPLSPLGARLAGSGPLIIEGIALDRPSLTAVYAVHQNQPIWTGHPEWAAALVTAISGSGAEGIPPASVGLAGLQHALSDSALNEVDRDLILTDRYLAYAAMLGRGRVDLTTVQDSWALTAPIFDPVWAVAQLETQGGPAVALQKMAPESLDYANLRTALARYEAIAGAGGWESLPAGTKIEPGDRGPNVLTLRRRLATEGDLAADLTDGAAFDDSLVTAVKSFQTRNGLLVDGRVGATTLTALNLSATERVQQIRVNLERLRGMPHFLPPTRIEVQEGSQMLTLFQDGKPTLVSKVIIGTPNHATPVLESDVESIILDPTWDVPVSIIRNELLPRLDSDPGYLERNHYVGSGYSIHQLPGPWNALGTVMLNMPNQFDVYLHDTPAHNLYALPQRALSHGCVRVEAVRELAGILAGKPIPAAGGSTRSLTVETPMPVYFLYMTAFAGPDGTVQFRSDVYNRDAQLGAVLAMMDQGNTTMPVSSVTPPAKEKQVAGNATNTLAP